jgi:NADH:ubiquinone oxidoreductase subunit 2 (subunit N)
VALNDADTNHLSTVLIPLAWLAIAVYVLISMQSRKTKAWFGR